MTVATIGEGTGLTYAGENDTNLLEASPTNTNDTVGYMYPYATGAGNRRHGLIIYTGLSNISPSVTVSAVDFQLRNNSTTANITVALHRVLVPWTASQASWNLRSTGVNWATAGGFNSTDVDMAPVATFALNTGTDFINITGNSALNALVEGWINGTIPNYGLMVVRSPDTAYDGVLSSINGGLAPTAASRPKLTVTYTAGSPPPTVSTNPDVSVTEGGSAVHTITLSGATTASTPFAATLAGSGSNPATGGGADFVSDLSSVTYSNGVTHSGGTLTVPSGVTSFTVTIPTTGNALDNADKTYTLTVGGVASVGTITDNDAAPSITITPSITVDGGDSVVLTCTLGAVSGRVTQARLVLTDGTKVGGVDYTNTITNGMLSDGVTISAGVLSIPALVGSFTITIPTAA